MVHDTWAHLTDLKVSLTVILDGGRDENAYTLCKVYLSFTPGCTWPPLHVLARDKEKGSGLLLGLLWIEMLTARSLSVKKHLLLLLDHIIMLLLLHHLWVHPLGAHTRLHLLVGQIELHLLLLLLLIEVLLLLLGSV